MHDLHLSVEEILAAAEKRHPRRARIGPRRAHRGRARGGESTCGDGFRPTRSSNRPTTLGAGSPRRRPARRTGASGADRLDERQGVARSRGTGRRDTRRACALARPGEFSSAVDGSAGSRAALTAARALFPDARLLLAGVRDRTDGLDGAALSPPSLETPESIRRRSNSTPSKAMQRLRCSRSPRAPKSTFSAPGDAAAGRSSTCCWVASPRSSSSSPLARCCSLIEPGTALALGVQPCATLE